MTQEDFQGLLPAYALGALSTVENTQVETYLLAHPDQQAELCKWQETITALVWAVDEIEPPARLAEKIKQHRVLSPAVKAAPAASNVALFPTSAKANLSIVPERFAGYRRAVILTVAAAALLLVALGFVWRHNHHLSSENQLLRQQLQNLQTEQLNESAWQQNLLGPDGRGIILQGTAAAPEAFAHLAYNIRDGQAFLSARALPPAPPGKNYQLWFITQDKIMPGDTFNTNNQGEARVKLHLPVPGLRAKLFAVTLESQNGNTQPSGEKYLVNTVS